MTASILPGLCSVTFRRLSAAAVIDLAARCGLTGIEWGADVHVPPADLRGAVEVARRSADAGLTVLSYGSYLFAGQSPDGDGEPVWDTGVGIGSTVTGCPSSAGPSVWRWHRTLVPDGVVNTGGSTLRHTSMT